MTLSGCSRSSEKLAVMKAPDIVLATVNGEPIYNKDLKISLAIQLKKDPNLRISPETLNKQIELIIDEKLILQRKNRSDSIIKIIR
jgi:hypothetical protein